MCVCVCVFSLLPLAISSCIICTACQATYSQGHKLDIFIHVLDISSIACTACQATYRPAIYTGYQPLNMESVSFTSLTHVTGCSKCGRPSKGHPLLYGATCALALAKECTDESSEIPACGVEGPAVLLLLGPSAPGQPIMVDNAAWVLVEQHPNPPDRMTQEKTASLVTTTTTITTGGSTECSLAVLSTRLGQQDEQVARNR